MSTCIQLCHVITSHDNGKCRHVFNYVVLSQVMIIVSVDVFNCVMLSQVMILVSVDMYSIMSCYHKS